MKKYAVSEKNGFTLLEVMVALMILGILVTIAINGVINYRQKGFIGTVRADLKNAHKAAFVYFSERANGEVTLPDLQTYGFSTSRHVTVSIPDADRDTYDDLYIEGRHSGIPHLVFYVEEDGEVHQM